MSKVKIRRQKAFKGGRIPKHASLLPEVVEIIDTEARRFRVTKSFVVATALNDYFNVRSQERYDELDRPKLRRVK